MIVSSEFESESTDSIEARLVELETLVGQIRGVQVGLLRELSVRQVPLSDACRSLAERMVSRMDVAPETAASVSRLVYSDSEPVEVALTAGEITADRAVELTRFDSDDPVTEAEGFAMWSRDAS